LRATFLLVNLVGHQEFVDLDAFVAARKALRASGRSEQHDVLAGAEVEKADLAQDPARLAAHPASRRGVDQVAGCISTAARVVNAIDWICRAPKGLISVEDIPPVDVIRGLMW
jgi:hypothetical protein